MYEVKLNNNLSFKTDTKEVGEKIKDLIDAVVCAAELSDCEIAYHEIGGWHNCKLDIQIKSINNSNCNCTIRFYVRSGILRESAFADGFVKSNETGQEAVHRTLEKALKFLSEDGEFVNFAG